MEDDLKMTMKNEIFDTNNLDEITDRELDLLEQDPFERQDFSTPEDEDYHDEYDDNLYDEEDDDIPLLDLEEDLEEQEYIFDEDIDDFNEDSLNNEDNDENNDEDPFEDDNIDDDDEDLFAMVKPKRKAKLPENVYSAQVGDVNAEKMDRGKFGKPWIRVTIPFNIKHPKTGEIVTVPFFANKSTGKNSRLYPIIKGILGRVPDEEYSLKHLIGKKVQVVIEHNEDDDGNIWENIVLVRPVKR